MPLPVYQDTGPLVVPESIDLQNLVGKSVLITGGTSQSCQVR
jgi:hypothetical protein